MKKISPNSNCPCGSGKKYKKCCQIYHKGALPPNALALMKSRYSAYVANNANYIIKTTHPNNPDYTEDTKSWKESILSFSKNTQFLGLEILEFIDGKEEAFVTFRAKFGNGEMIEKSHFLKIDNRWLYYKEAHSTFNDKKI
jgi:SEC-C motif-containing protein